MLKKLLVSDLFPHAEEKAVRLSKATVGKYTEIPTLCKATCIWKLWVLQLVLDESFTFMQPAVSITDALVT